MCAAYGLMLNEYKSEIDYENSRFETDKDFF